MKKGDCLTVSRHGPAVIFGALDSAAKAFSVTVAGRKSGDLLAVDKHSLRVVTAGILEFVCMT